MKMRWWMALGVASIFALGGNAARAQDHEHGRGHERGRGDDREHHDGDHRDRYRRGDDDRDSHGWYNYRDRERMHLWYQEREDRDDLPPGLARRDRLPPGLERQLVLRGELPPGLRRRMEPVPESLERDLPPPPPDCEHAIIGGHIVLMNRRTFVVLDIFHFER